MVTRTNKWRLRILDAVLAAILVTFAATIGLVDDIDAKTSDWLYQKPGEKSDDIVVIGIDAATLEKLGPLPTWARRRMAQAIDYLNNKDSSKRPAVIGIDVMFTGNNRLHPEYDEALTKAADEYKNVVVASKADEDENKDLEAKTNDKFYPWNRIWPWDAPFDGLLTAAETGHINAPKEKDGITRHALLYVDVEEKGRLQSFGRVIYEKWCGLKNQTPNMLTTDGNGLFYLPFSAETYNSGYNFADLIEGNVPPDAYAGKIVLIGPYANGMTDEFPTAIDRTGVMYGIDIHANVINAFQKGFFPKEVSDAPQLILLFLAAFLSELFFREGKMRHIVLWWLGLSVGSVIFCKIMYTFGFIFHAAWIPFFGSILFVGAVMTNHYVHAKEENARINAAFGRYFDPAVMEKLLTGNPEVFALGGKSRNIAALFVDIRGFTTMSEKLPAESVVEILNSYLALVTGCVYKHGGTLDKFIGDAVMAFWNAPLEQKDPVLSASRAALDMVKGIPELNEEIQKKYGVDISFGIGIHWGNAVVGNIGADLRMDYTAIGDTVNTAARLEANAAGGQILISRAAVEELGDYAETEKLDKKIILKGKEKDFEILALKNIRERG